MFSPAILFAVGVLFLLYVIHQKRRQAKLPPGPPRLPLIGNLHQAPADAPWLTFNKWIHQYGPLVSVDFGGTTLILIGDYDIARDLLDKRANIYRSRPRMVMAGELTMKGMHIMLRPFDEEFLLHQRLAASILSPRASACYTPLQDLESKVLLKNLLSTNANDFPRQYERFSASIVYALTYGFRIVTGDEWQLQTAHEVLKNFTYAGQVGAWIVDAIPVLNYLPAALAPWKKTAEKWYQIEENLHMVNMKDALAREGWNWTKDMKNGKEAESLSDIEIAYDLGINCDAGVETTNVTLQIFTLACLAFPDFIPKAQKELDEVVGQERLPNFDDLEMLPYIQAVVEENFRWRHIVPAGIPHATSKEDYYKGYLIPKGSTIIPMFYSMRKDENLFDSPLDFRPERWIGKSQPSNFGYGRRVCPGRFIARNSVSIAIARLLWAFNIQQATKEGKTVVDENTWTTGFVSAPKPFEAVFEPRSEQHKKVIEREFNAADMDVSRILNDVRKRQVAVGLIPRA
ncbi:putative O-methylsterigmatocystin oxidoreductase [Zopfia rhizophila CBS 207.26]|uniref:Putative O-methylsterigmatocystin oxidoreductase n=1 Tax=Zopfia rhizophila CBS 207.26 TaxID=1314779 RepID=A0A6A6EZ04_9PEZI|nr:putative O-methylsterigmatocystin oxidoreductase [Zopfia rhizophila CBS 207.26]